jgi:hypothetical protein
MKARIVLLLSLLLLILGSMAPTATARPAPDNEKLGACEASGGDYQWQPGGWYCNYDTNENPGGQSQNDKWDNETETTTKGNSGKTRDTQTCIYNPGGKLHKGSDDDC